MKRNYWFQKSLHRLLVDMHIPDWDSEFLSQFDPEVYADMMKLAKVDTAEIYAGSCLGLCYWPTKIGYQHKQLNGRDLLGETMEACRKRGITPQVYLNVWNRAAHDDHPEWRVRMMDGQGTCDHLSWRFGLCCHNTGYGEFFLKVLDELNASYETPGFWIDMIGNYYFCTCEACRKRFREETPFQDLPDTADWNDPVFLAYIECRAKWLGEFAKNIYETVKKRTPDRTVTLQTASIGRGRFSGINGDFLDSSDYLAGDFTGGSLQQSYVCKYFSMLSKHRPIEFMTPRCENLIHHTTTRSFHNLKMRAYAAVANQASFTLIDAIDPKGTLDRRFYETAGELNGTYSLYEDYISPDSVSIHDVAIYHSMESCIDLDNTPVKLEKIENSFGPPIEKHRTNIAQKLQKDHILWKMCRGNDVQELLKSPVIILHDCSSLTDSDCDALTEYVRNGGKLYASYRTSLYDPKKGMRKDFKLAECFGIHFTGENTQKITYISPVNDDVLNGVVKDYPLMLESSQLKITVDPETEVLGTLTLPISTAEELVRFGSAISNPPMRETGLPALTRHRFGKGEVIYVAGDLETLPFDLHCKVFTGLINQLSGDSRIVQSNAPAHVEFTLFDQPEEKQLVFSCLNLPVDLPAVPVHDVKISLKLPAQYQTKKVVSIPENKEITFEYDENGRMNFELPVLNEFALFVISY